MARETLLSLVGSRLRYVSSVCRLMLVGLIPGFFTVCHLFSVRFWTDQLDIGYSGFRDQFGADPDVSCRFLQRVPEEMASHYYDRDAPPKNSGVLRVNRFTHRRNGRIFCLWELDSFHSHKLF